MRASVPVAAAALGAALVGAPAAAEEAAPAAPTYALSYEARLVPTERAARVSIRIGDGAQNVKSIRLRIDPERHIEFEGDGVITREEGEETSLLWEPPSRGGALRYVFRIDHLRDAATYDARCAENWVLFRGDDLVPPASVVTDNRAEARATLRLRVPPKWRHAAPYEETDNGRYVIDNPERRFDRPTGWMIAGRLGITREKVAGVHVAIAAPVGQGFRRLDLLALLRWTLPVLRDIVGNEALPDRLLIVGADDPMWRGGLSGPKSVYVHADRPLLSNDGTSPLLHELMHSVLGISPGPGADWFVEGVAELYSLEMLARSKTLSRRRFQKSLRKLAERGRAATGLVVDRATGVVTARAVGVLRDLDEAIRAATQDARDLDDLLRAVLERGGKVTNPEIRTLAEELAGESLGPFFRRHGLASATAAR